MAVIPVMTQDPGGDESKVCQVVIFQGKIVRPVCKKQDWLLLHDIISFSWPALPTLQTC